MEIQDYQNRKELGRATPPLIKQSPTYKLKVPKEVEEKIRYLLRKFPSTEWSGVLFYTHTGSFEGNDLTIICKDIFPMDLGNATFTEFKMSEDVTAYIADNIELFECDLGLVHSHHCMSTTFSGTDINTLREEGDERNCFVSLIVNNAGTYSAAITRKIQAKHEVTVRNQGTSYEFFGEGTIQVIDPNGEEVKQVVEKETIQYFMLDVEREEVDNPLSWLDMRFKEIEERKKADIRETKTWSPLIVQSNKEFEKDSSFYDYMRKEDTRKEPSLFSEEEMGNMESAGWEPDKKVIHELVCKMIACSLIVNTSNFDLKQWVIRHMEKKYGQLFSQEMRFDEWKDFIVEFMINSYQSEEGLEEAHEDPDMILYKIADAMYEEISNLPSNSYLEGYMETLMRYNYYE